MSTPLSRCLNVSTDQYDILADIILERASQDQKWGQQDHPDVTEACNPHQLVDAEGAQLSNDVAVEDGSLSWMHILWEEVWEAHEEAEVVYNDDTTRLEAELTQVAAVVVAHLEAIRRRKAKPRQLTLPVGAPSARWDVV